MSPLERLKRKEKVLMKYKRKHNQIGMDLDSANDISLRSLYNWKRFLDPFVHLSVFGN